MLRVTGVVRYGISKLQRWIRSKATAPAAIATPCGIVSAFGLATSKAAFVLYGARKCASSVTICLTLSNAEPKALRVRSMAIAIAPPASDARMNSVTSLSAR